VGPPRILLIVTPALWSAGFLLQRRLSCCAGARATGLAPAVSVIIPARNEEHNLPAPLRSLFQYRQQRLKEMFGLQAKPPNAAAVTMP
jgi:hypothetical protein